MRKKFFLIGKIALTVLSLLGAVALKFLKCDQYSDYIEIAYDISVGVFSAMILVWFIDEISSHIQERQSRQKEFKAIKRFDSVLQQYIEQYITMYYCVATPISNRKFDNVQMPEQFSLKDMRDLHQTSLLVKEGFTSGSIDSFLQIELALRKEFISLTEKYDFEYFPQFVDIFTKYIQVSLKYDSRDAIKDNSSKIKIDHNHGKFIHDLLENNADDYYNKMKQGEDIGGNIAHPYIFIFEMMNVQRQCIEAYQNEVEKLTIEKVSIFRKVFLWFEKISNRIKIGVSKLRREKVKLFFAKYGKWVSAGIIVLFIGALTFLFCKFNLVEKIGTWSGETIAVIGTLLGAIIGGIFTLIGSVYINRKQLKAQTHIKRKNLIYKPLYDELCEIEYSILAENPFPPMIVFKPMDFGSLKYPQYTVWGRIKSDTRYLETPKNLIFEIDKLFEKIDNYQRARSEDNEVVTSIANNILQNVLGTQSTLLNLGDCLIKYALVDDDTDFYDYYQHSLKEKVEITEDQKKEIKDQFYEECRKNEKIINIKNAKKEWASQQAIVIELLTDLINYVNIKYEG